MNFQQITHDHRTALLDLAAQHGLSNLRVFGSVARGEAGPGSDIDLLATVPVGMSLLLLCRFERLAEESLGMPVQLVAEDSLHPQLAPGILRDALPL
jgi:predicted nucleotidyltransferase